MQRRTRTEGFTLLEICVVLFLVVVLMSVAVPSLSGQLGRRRLQGAFDRLDMLATQARERSMTDGKPYLLVWEQNGAVCLYPGDLSVAARRKAGPISKLFPGDSDEHYTLLRSASLTSGPAPEWTFWPTGTCEPVTVRYDGGGGEWVAVFNPLSGRGTFSRFVAR